MQADSSAADLEANGSNHGSPSVFCMSKEAELPQGFSEGEAVSFAYIEHRVIVHYLGAARCQYHEAVFVGTLLERGTQQAWYGSVGKFPGPRTGI